MPFAITVTEKTVNTNLSATFDRYNTMIVVGTSTTDTTFRNTLTIVNDINDFTTKFGASSPSLPYFRFIFANDTTKQNTYYFINGWVNAGTVLQNLQSGITALGALIDIDPCIVVIPEASQLSVQADRTAVFTSMHTIAALRDHSFYFNLGTVTNTKVLALAERALYQSPNGNAQVYYEFYKDTLDIEIPIALHAAVVHLVKGWNEDPYQPPAGVAYPAQGIKGIRLNNLILTAQDFNDFQNNGINTADLIPKSKYCVMTSRTLATDDRWLNINTRVAVTITRLKLILALTQYIQSSSDPQGRVGRQAERAAYTVMENQFNNGALSADSPGDMKSSFKITLTPVNLGNKRRTKLKIQMKAVDALEEIQLEIVNTIVLV